MGKDSDKPQAVKLKDQADMVEIAGETTAADTGPTEIGAAAGIISESNRHPVGEGTMIEVADADDSNEERQ